MTSAITLTISGVGGGGTWPLSFTFPTNNSSPLSHVATALVNGANTLTPPAGATQLLVVPPAGSTITKTLKGITGDSGIPIHVTTPTLLSLPPSAGTLVLTTNGVETVDLYWF